MSALHCTKWILVLVIDRYDLLVFCRPFSVCRVHCMKLVQTKPLLSGMSNCNHLLFVLALTFEWLVLPNESVSHNCTSTLFWNIMAICWAFSCSDWIQECLKKNTSVCTKPRRYYEGSYHLHLPPPPPKKTTAPPNLLQRCDLSQLILETWLKRNVSVIK